MPRPAGSAESMHEKEAATAAPDHMLWEMRTEILGLLAHDLRNPLNAICLGARLLGERKLTPEREARQLRLMEAACLRMSSLIEDLLALARIESGQFPMHRSPIAVSVLVKESVRNCQAAAEELGLRLVSAVEPPMLSVRVDTVLMIRALVILLDHAVRRSPAHGTVSLQAAGRDGSVFIEVADEGPPLEETEELFDWHWGMEHPGYRRAEASLALARRLIELHDGHIARRGATRLQLTLPLQNGAVSDRLFSDQH